MERRLTWNEPASALFQMGPVSMRILARLDGHPHPKGVMAAARAAEDSLVSLVRRKEVAFSNIESVEKSSDWPPVLALMVAAARAVGYPQVTPMVAVAGAIAELSARAAIEAGAGTCVVDNGGDVALEIEEGDEVKVGVARSLDDRRFVSVVTLRPGDSMRGVCTSGLGGRSFTLGVADSATAFGATASVADACATLLCNATAVDDPAVTRRRAEDLDCDTDVPGFLVTTGVGRLNAAIKGKALAQAREEAVRLMGLGLLDAAVVTVQGQTLLWPAGHPLWETSGHHGTAPDRTL